MAKAGRKDTNELEFQGQVVVWLNQEISRRQNIQIDMATQEKPRRSSGKRSDLIVWTDRSSESAFLAIELKTPTTPINDPVLFSDAIEKAQYWNAKYFAIWNMRDIEVYRTPVPGSMRPLPTDAVRKSTIPLAITRVEDWLVPAFAAELRKQALDLFDAAVLHHVTGSVAGHAIDAEIFVARLTETLSSVRALIYRDINIAAAASKALRSSINRIATEQGFKGFVADTHYAIAGQIGYRFIGQILFYHALRRKIPTLKAIELDASDEIPKALQIYWNEVRRYDYEALFKPEPIDVLVPIASEAQSLIRRLVEQLGTYDWNSLTDDVLGSIFEHLIPRSEQILLGQFYTPRPVADLLTAFTVDGEMPLVLDPGCGSGTFLMSCYGYLAYSRRLSHKDLLSTIWGFDISPFAAELAVINLYRQDMAEFENFPRIVPGNFFERTPGQTVEFPAPRITAGNKKIPVPVPKFDCVIGNPPYLRSQNQDDLDPKYRDRLFQAAAKVGIKAQAKTDLFAFFIYHSIQFMKEGSRLGFVTPASWLTADYASTLQRTLLGSLRLKAVIASSAESFFPQVDINTVLLVAEMSEKVTTDSNIQFITLKQPVLQLTRGSGDYWSRVVNLVQEIEDLVDSHENEKYRVKIVSANSEKKIMENSTGTVNNWSKYMRAPLSYYRIFGDTL